MRDAIMTDTPVHTEGEDRRSRWMITCDHATNRVPDWIDGGDLGIAPEDMARHIAFDPGALGVTRRLAKALDAPAVWSDFSRLVIDPNRGEDDPTLVMRLYDGTVIPANRAVTQADIETRLNRLYRPYHFALSQLAGARDDRAICAIHSFTPQLKGRAPRPWHCAILHSHLDGRLAYPVITRLAAMGYCVGDNEPYGGHLDGDSIARHALGPKRPNILIEVRNDLIADEAGQQEWADILARALDGLLEEFAP